MKSLIKIIETEARVTGEARLEIFDRCLAHLLGNFYNQSHASSKVRKFRKILF